MQGFEQFSHKVVGTVGGQRVLGQVIRSNADKVGTLCKSICKDSGSRGFNHNTNRHVLVKLHALGSKPVFADSNFLKCSIDLFHTRNHREHQADIAVHRGAQDGADLTLEDVRTIEQEADTAQAQGRIVFTVRNALSELITSNIEH